MLDGLKDEAISVLLEAPSVTGAVFSSFLSEVSLLLPLYLWSWLLFLFATASLREGSLKSSSEESE